MARFQRLRLYCLGLLIAVVPLGLASKVYVGPGQRWVEGYLGDLLYEVAWMLFVAAIWPRIAPGRLAMRVFGATAAVELLQLWQPPWLQVLRGRLLGKLLLGSTFVSWDFLYYALGCGLGWLLLHRLQRSFGIEPL